MQDNLIIGPHTIKPGEKKQIQLPITKLYTDTDICIPVYVHRALKPGPKIFISAAIHGDELNGIAILKRLIKKKGLKLLKGTLIAVPMVNVYGVLGRSRYMPDRRDLNRCFPGTKKGSLASRFAYMFFNEIVKQCEYGIDLHTGAIHRTNLPQIRASMKDIQTKKLARAFGAPVIVDSNTRDGSLRQAALDAGIKILLYEAGEALRFDELAIRTGLTGVLNVLGQLGMVKKSTTTLRPMKPFVAKNSAWLRAPASGIVRDLKKVGTHIDKGDILAEITDPFGNATGKVKALQNGVIIGKQNIPLVQEGDGMYHIAYFDKPREVAAHIESFGDDVLST